MANNINVTDDFVCVCLSLGGGSCRHSHPPFRCQQESTHLSTMNENADHQWEIKKDLTWSDCVRLNRLLLTKDLANNYVIPVLMGGAEAAEKKEGVEVQVWDVDTKSLHSLVFKIWAGESHVFTKTWFEDFVIRRNLKRGDAIGLHWDQANQRFNFAVLNKP